ncbi:DNA (cytosine-5-)-methyltransferase [Porticoccaceae bacterium]|jgi:DNA (cytosine-5)-methyltransferase 1|nr:DNA (cytosine-5-)-methyltransferase [Porticoccaceae bacterium]
MKKIPENDPNRPLHEIITHITKSLQETNPALALDPNLFALLSHWLENQQLDLELYAPIQQAQAIEALEQAEIALGTDHSELIKNTPFRPVDAAKFTFVDLFAGIGGFRQAFQELGGKCLFSSEWEKSAQQTYFRNYGECPFGDINQFTTQDSITGNMRTNKDINKLIPDHDVLAAGFPCQPFSKAGVSARESLGKAHGFECDTQGTLFYSVARIAKVKQPKFLFLENVRNIVGHDKGQTFETIKKTIDEIGYKFHYDLIDSSSLVPQRRLRCYMICVRKDIAKKAGAFEFPEFSGDPLPLSSILEKNPDPMYTISQKLWEGHIRRTTRNLARGAGFTAHVADISRPSNTIVSRYYKDGKECLIHQKGKTPRLLTIQECVQLFGYNRSETRPFLHATSRTASYRQFGNSVVVPVIHKIARVAVEQYINIKPATKRPGAVKKGAA